LRATFEPGQALPGERGASARVLLSGLPSHVRDELLADLAKRDPAAAVRVEEQVEQAAADGWAVSQEEIDRGIWAASAPVTDGRAVVAALTVPSPFVRAPAELQDRLLAQVRAAAAVLSRRVQEAREYGPGQRA
jgi:DNA-binding IclR family transcriptional regulator